MFTSIDSSRFNLHKIGKEYRDNFKPRTGSTDLSAFETFFLQMLGDALRPVNSEHFWSVNSYCWYVREYDETGDPRHDHQYGVWLTTCGVAVFEDYDTDELFRIEF